VLVLAFHRNYERTCANCGYKWVLTRKEAQFMPRPHTGGLRAPGGPQYYADDAVNVFEHDVDQQDELAEQFKRCARCGMTSYQQRPVTRRHPADPQAARPSR
jgi:ribosomal protein L37E